MKREILFRGKRIDNGEWVMGYLFPYSKHGFKSLMIGSGTTASSINGFEVTTDTVGQFIGLTDKNGKMIFEGDCFGNKNIPTRHIVFEDSKFCFNKIHSQGADVLSQDRIGRLEIIGNIHDNPEMI